MSNAIDIRAKLEQFSEHWSPKTVARLNDYDVKIVKILGEFVWHSHEDTDELFLVVDGELDIEFRDGTTHLRAGQLCVVPKGKEHRPVAITEAHILLIEPKGVVNTGDSGGALTAVPDESLLES